MKKVWKFLRWLKFSRLANTIAAANSSRYAWKMVPCLIPDGVMFRWQQSFVNGWYSETDYGWVTEVDDDGFIDSDPKLEHWDMRVDWPGDITVRIPR